MKSSGNYNDRSVYFFTRGVETPFARVVWFMPWGATPISTFYDAWRS